MAIHVRQDLAKKKGVREEVEQPFLLTSFYPAAHNLQGIPVS
jgi:hypothetical protein